MTFTGKLVWLVLAASSAPFWTITLADEPERAGDRHRQELLQREAESPWTSDNGGQIRVLQMSNGVFVRQWKDGGESRWDESGHGALLCIWAIYRDVGALTAACPNFDSNQRHLVGRYVNGLRDFIAWNHPSPQSLNQITGRLDKQRENRYRAWRQLIAHDRRTEECTGGFLHGIATTIADSLKDYPSDQPLDFGPDRLPVMKPCL